MGQRRAGAAVGVLAWAAALALLAHAPVGGAESVQGHPDGGSSGRDSAEARAMGAAARKGGVYVWRGYGVYTGGPDTAYIRRIIRIYGVLYVLGGVLQHIL